MLANKTWHEEFCFGYLGNGRKFASFHSYSKEKSPFHDSQPLPVRSFLASFHASKLSEDVVRYSTYLDLETILFRGREDMLAFVKLLMQNTVLERLCFNGTKFVEDPVGVSRRTNLYPREAFLTEFIFEMFESKRRLPGVTCLHLQNMSFGDLSVKDCFEKLQFIFPNVKVLVMRAMRMILTRDSILECIFSGSWLNTIEVLCYEENFPAKFDAYLRRDPDLVAPKNLKHLSCDTSMFFPYSARSKKWLKLALPSLITVNCPWSSCACPIWGDIHPGYPNYITPKLFHLSTVTDHKRTDMCARLSRIVLYPEELRDLKIYDRKVAKHRWSILFLCVHLNRGKCILPKDLVRYLFSFLV